MRKRPGQLCVDQFHVEQGPIDQAALEHLRDGLPSALEHNRIRGDRACCCGGRSGSSRPGYSGIGPGRRFLVTRRQRGTGNAGQEQAGQRQTSQRAFGRGHGRPGKRARQGSLRRPRNSVNHDLSPSPGEAKQVVRASPTDCSLIYSRFNRQLKVVLFQKAPQRVD